MKFLWSTNAILRTFLDILTPTALRIYFAINMESIPFAKLRRASKKELQQLLPRESADALEARVISGHKTRSVFDRYHIVSQSDLLAAKEKLETFGNVAGMKS